MERSIVGRGGGGVGREEKKTRRRGARYASVDDVPVQRTRTRTREHVHSECSQGSPPPPQKINPGLRGVLR